MAYLVFARKYRPLQFEDVVGQTHVTRTLANAVTSGRLAHAILLSGPRGTGKTTIARILAKCMNCRSGSTATPCLTCPSCQEITRGNAGDVFEIDGASNNKVENIRELRENAKYMPAQSPYKIYIIDEVHMLSDSAFNALLKILEEPPAHVLFFFATTEPHKIPITILSRCQRYDLRRIDLSAIAGHLGRICEAEGIAINEEALSLIAREADGSIRDSLSLLDQIITCSTGPVTHEQVIDVLGVIDRQILFDVSAALFAGDMAGLLEICDLLYRQGRHLMKFYAELIEHFRNLLLVKMGGATDALAKVAEHEHRQMTDQITEITEPYIHQVLSTLIDDEWRIKQSVSPKLALEMTFFKLLQIRPAFSLDTLIEKLDQLRTGVAPAAPGSNPGSLSSAAGSSPGRRSDKTAAAVLTPEPEPVADNTAAATERMPEAPAPLPEVDLSPDFPDTPNSPLSPDSPLFPASYDDSYGIAADSYDAAHDAAHDAAPSEPGPEPDANPCPAATFEDKSPEEVWEGLRPWICEKSPALGSCLAESALTAIEDDCLRIEVRSVGTNVNLLRGKKSIANLENLCGTFFGRPMRVTMEIEKAAQHAKQQKTEAKNLKDEALNHPLITSAVTTFNGKIVDIKLL